jgi:hypothetical protein
MVLRADSLVNPARLSAFFFLLAFVISYLFFVVWAWFMGITGNNVIRRQAVWPASTQTTNNQQPTTKLIANTD